MRAAGALLLLGGAAALGCSAAAGLGRHVRVLEALSGALELMERELSFRLTPMPELMDRLARRSAPPVDQLFAHCRDGLEALGEVPLAALWREGLGLESLGLEAEERSALDLLGDVLGRYDGQGQLEALAQTRGELDQALERARGERDRMGRVYRVLGVTGGLLLVILLL